MLQQNKDTRDGVPEDRTAWFISQAEQPATVMKGDPRHSVLLRENRVSWIVPTHPVLRFDDRNTLAGCRLNQLYHNGAGEKGQIDMLRSLQEEPELPCVGIVAQRGIRRASGTWKTNRMPTRPIAVCRSGAVTPACSGETGLPRPKSRGRPQVARNSSRR